MIKVIPIESGDVIICNWNVVGHLAGWIETLFASSRKLKNGGALSAMVVDPDDNIYVHGGFISPRIHCPVSYAMGEKFYGQYPGTREVEVTHFICGIIKKELLQKLPIPENLGENPFVDADYCLEARKLGFKIYATSDLMVQYSGMAGLGVSEREYAGKFDTAYQEFNKKWGNEYDSKFSLPVMYQTSIGMPSGFAQAARGYIKGLTENGVKVSYNYLRGTNEEEDESEDLVVNSICEDHGHFKMPQIIWAQAPYFNKNSGIYKIGHCEFEGEWVPSEWADSCNTMDELWVPTNWDREKFRHAGVNVPIYTFGQGIDKNYFHPDMAPMRFEAPEKFKFICNAAFDPRKNIPGLIAAFKNEFKKVEDVCLIVKTMNLGLTSSVSDEIKKIKYSKDSAQVYVKEDRFRPYEMGSFYTAGDCFVLPTRGEAWGLPLMEALACGIPVITTGWGAPDEILRDDTGNPYPGVKFIRWQKSLTDTPYVYLQGNYWAEPSIPHLQKLMRESFENRDKERKEALKTSEIIRQKYDWTEITKPIKERIKEIYKEKMD